MLLLELGLPFEPDVTIGSSNGADMPISLFVGDRPCLFPNFMLGETLSHVDQEADVTTATDDVVRHLSTGNGSGVPGDRIARFLGILCRSALSAHPGKLADGLSAEIRTALDLGMFVGHVLHEPERPEFAGGVEPLLATLANPNIDIVVNPSYLRVLTESGAGVEHFPYLREGLFIELGVPLPPFRLCFDSSLPAAGFAVRLQAVRLPTRIGLSTGTVLVNTTAEILEPNGVEATPTLNPATQRPGAIVSQMEQERLEAAQYVTWDPLGFMILAAAADIRRNAYVLIDSTVSSRLVQELGVSFPELEQGAERHLDPGVVAHVLRDLLHDGVPIRDMRRILQILLRFETAPEDRGVDDRMIFVRRMLADTIANKFSAGTATLVVYLVDTKLEATLEGRDLTRHPAGWDDPVLRALRTERAFLPPTAQVPAVLTRDALRPTLQALVREEFPDVTVLGYSDLPPDFNIQPVARLG